MALLIAGTHSGVGKTTVTLAIMAALRRRGISLAPFKLGPDFLDPGHLAAAAGRPCGNLDLWMLGRAYVQARLAAAAAAGEFAVIEAMMGLHDGRSGMSAEGSPAEFARRFNLPTLLVVDASAMARSLAALVRGFRDFDPAVPLAGIIANRVGGPGHVRYLEDALAGESLPLLGALPLDPAWKIPERHLGLAMSQEGSPAERWPELAAWAERHLQLDRLLELGRCPPVAPAAAANGRPPAAVPAAPNPLPASGPPRLRLGVARDAAFSFYYEDNLRLLAAAGADLVEFSPLRDSRLPPRLAGIYFGGGYPELHAAAFEANRSLRLELREFAAAGRLIYAECGGLMALARSLSDAAGRAYAMAGVLPIDIRMCARLRALGYREVAPLGLGEAAARLRLRGHEFHYSEIVQADSLPPAWQITWPADGPPAAGYRLGSVLAGYIHLHFASCPEFPRLLVERMRAAFNRTSGRHDHMSPAN